MPLSRIRQSVRFSVTSVAPPDPPDPPNNPIPLTTDVRHYIFGHSLINHQFGEGNDITNILIWLHELAEQAGYSYAMSGQYGFGSQHVATLPSPAGQWGVLGVTAANTAEDLIASEWVASNFNTVMFTPANFRQEFAANASSGNWPDITTETTAALFDFAETTDPDNARYVIYENWGDMGSYTSADFSSTFPTAGELTTYWNHIQGTFNDWWINYQDVMLGTRPDLDIQMIPVGPILGKLLLGTLSSITPAALYEDNSPHGRPTLYFLAGLITYMGTYGVKSPSDYVVPNTIDSIVLTNYATIVNEIWTELLNFNYADGTSRVFPAEIARENLGGNLNGITNFSSSETFTNMFKMARLIPSTDAIFDTEETIIADSDGYPTRIPTGVDSEIYRRVQWFWSRHALWAGGRFVFTWTGTGNFIYSGMTVISSGANRVVIDLPPAMEGGIIIDAITEGDHPRNMKLVLEADEALDTVANPFNPAWLNTLTIYEAYRFMDWAQTNNNPQVTWSDRPIESSANYSDGVPIEVMVKLMNETQRNGWFCIPHQADDNYVNQMATLVLANLNSNLSVQIEYSNEVWNYLFTQGTFAATQANALWGGGDTFENRLNYYGYRSNQVIGLWKTVWTGETARVKGVLGSQSDNTYTVTEALTCPVAGGGCDANIDQLAIAPYFGNEMGTDNSRLAEFEAATITEVLDELENTELPLALAVIDDNVVLADANSLELVAYEGGQHMIWHGDASTVIDDLFIAANEATRIESIYDTYFNGWKARTNGIYMNFSHIGVNSKFGSWNSMEYLQNFTDNPRPPKRLSLEKF